MVSELPIAETAGPQHTADAPLVDVLVQVLIADGLTARRTAQDRLVVTTISGASTEWCCVAGLVFGRSTAGLGEASWVHRLSAGLEVAPFELGREVSRIVRQPA